MRKILQETLRATGVLAVMMTGFFDGEAAMELALSAPDPDPAYHGTHRRGVTPRLT